MTELKPDMVKGAPVKAKLKAGKQIVKRALIGTNSDVVVKLDGSQESVLCTWIAMQAADKVEDAQVKVSTTGTIDNDFVQDLISEWGLEQVNTGKTGEQVIVTHGVDESDSYITGDGELVPTVVFTGEQVWKATWKHVVPDTVKEIDNNPGIPTSKNNLPVNDENVFLPVNWNDKNVGSTVEKENSNSVDEEKIKDSLKDMGYM